MPKFKLLVDVDSVVDEAEHLEEIFKDGFDCSEEEAERIVQAVSYTHLTLPTKA